MMCQRLKKGLSLAQDIDSLAKHSNIMYFIIISV